MITSLQNPRVREVLALRDGRHRRRQGRFLIDGTREISRALAAGIEIEEVFVRPALCGGDDAAAGQLLRGLAAAAVRQTEVSPAVFERLAFGERAEGIVAVARPPHTTLDDLQLPNCPLVAVLEGVEKPGNVGAVLRSADGAGVAALLVADGGTDLYNPNTIRASLGTIFTLPVRATTALAARDWLARRNIPTFAARVDAAKDYTEADFTGPAAILLGSESHGLSTAWSGCTTSIRLPMLGAADSLNVSATAAVLFYEALRQRASSATESPSM
ncbi:MAG TPA: RNA methyltransferase [Pirellulales bacterium]|jgi:TrmH family RNA methyltransferase|nr:RNA methyltransferase [Pirellulales bacterium]